MGTAIFITVFATLLAIGISVYLLYRWLLKEALALLRLKRSMSAEELRLMRRRLGYSQAGLAGELGVSIRAVQSWEQGWRRIPAHVALLVRVLRPFHFITSGREHGNEIKGRGSGLVFSSTETVCQTKKGGKLWVLRCL